MEFQSFKRYNIADRMFNFAHSRILQWHCYEWQVKDVPFFKVIKFKLMGFAGHVFDMIRRNRELRETQDLRRWRTRSIREKMCDNDHEMGINSELTASQWDEVRKQSRNRVAFERHSFFKFKLICLGVLAIVAAITVVVVYFVLGK